jgi:hypothetical protein
LASQNWSELTVVEDRSAARGNCLGRSLPYSAGTRSTQSERVGAALAKEVGQHSHFNAIGFTHPTAGLAYAALLLHIHAHWIAVDVIIIPGGGFYRT